MTSHLSVQILRETYAFSGGSSSICTDESAWPCPKVKTESIFSSFLYLFLEMIKEEKKQEPEPTPYLFTSTSQSAAFAIGILWSDPFFHSIPSTAAFIHLSRALIHCPAGIRINDIGSNTSNATSTFANAHSKSCTASTDAYIIPSTWPGSIQHTQSLAPSLASHTESALQPGYSLGNLRSRRELADSPLSLLQFTSSRHRMLTHSRSFPYRTATAADIHR